MDSVIDTLARLDVPPVLVAALAAFTVGYILYEFLVKRRIAASQAEKSLRDLMSDDADADTDAVELPVDSWGYKFQVAGITSIKPGQAKTYLYGASGLLAVIAFLVATAFGLAELISLGIGGFAAAVPTLYLNGKVDGTYGFFRSDDVGATWVRITDDKHQYGYCSVITGDPRVYGRVYVGTGGRGIVYGEPRE